MKEEEIRPKAIFERYIELAEKDANTYFLNSIKEDISCPVCSKEGKSIFLKNGFQYCECQDCNSIFVSPRPLSSYFNQYYTESDSAEFWATTFYKETAEARREKLWKPKSLLVKSILDKYMAKSDDYVVYDIGGGYGIFAEEMRKLNTNTIVIEPSPFLSAECRRKSIQVIEKFIEEIKVDDLERKPKIFVSFELFEHLHDPKLFLETVFHLMNERDILIFTTLSGTGIDIRLLWENSKSLTPPYHINFLNPHSIRLLNNMIGFQTLEVTTPGKLDIDILENNKQYINDSFWKIFFKYADDSTKAKMQSLISESGLSSHMMVVCTK